MTTLLMDGLIAAVKLIDRGLTAVEKNARLRWNSPLPVADAQPAGAGASAASGPGGHPIRLTSELLTHAVRELDYAFPAKTPAIVRDLMAEMRLRAAEFAAVGD